MKGLVLGGADENEPAGRDQLPNCVTAGIINTLPVLVAALQSTEALKLLSGGGKPITDFRVIDPWAGTFQSFKVARNPDCLACGKKGARR